MSSQNESRRNQAVPGSRWRILAHAAAEKVELENQGVLDELVLDDWLHLEQMDERQWCVRVGDARLWISLEGDGEPRVDVDRGFYKEVRGDTRTR